MSTTEERPTTTVPSPIGDLSIRADSARSAVVDLTGVRINSVDYSGTAYVHHVLAAQIQGFRADAYEGRAWIVGSFQSGELRRYDGLYLRRVESYDDPTPAARQKARVIVEAAVSGWSETPEGIDALAAAEEREGRHYLAAAAASAEALRQAADLIERVGRAVSRREAIRIEYRDAHTFRERDPGFAVAYWYAGEDRGVTVTAYDAAVPSDWRTPEGLR